MRDGSTSPDGTGDGPPVPANEDDSVGEVVRAAGRRPELPAEYMDEVRRTAGVVWRETIETYAARRRRRHARILAVAATLLVGLGAVTLLRSRLGPPATAPDPAATVEAANGPLAWEPGDAIAAGGEIVTGPDSRVALRLAAGHGARLDLETRLIVESTTVLRLHEGAVYLDSGGASRDAAITVRTPYGVARDVGTQFEVRLAEDALRVQVRTGRVEVEAPGASHAAPAGTALTVRADGSVESGAIASHGPGWTWTLSAAPPFTVEGRSLAEYLDWLARETGWRIAFADPELEREAAPARVHGTIEGLRPDQTPDLVVVGAGLAYRLEDGVLTIER